MSFPDYTEVKNEMIAVRYRKEQESTRCAAIENVEAKNKYCLRTLFWQWWIN